MNAIKLLKDDHKKVNALFAKFESLGERAYKQKKEVVDKVILELMVHTQIEEKIFYPEAEEALGKAGKSLITEAHEEHGVVKKLIVELQALSPENEYFDAKFTILMENVRHHVKEEEEELFPQAREALGSEIEPMGERMGKMKLEFQAALRMPHHRLEYKPKALKGGASSSHAAH